ncbi:MAG TPA: PASTA domain-containing protein [Oscillospiraceae bacterium]|nr:PASTA domain-containing protein [Oscillospiraceae bacterium]HPS35851.1 PASTA domain-containing protein [Oscillospiraceae bacterium]
MRGNFCFNCMKAFDGGTVCPNCGFNTQARQLPPALPYDSLLGGRYKVGRTVRMDGDSYTYTALDLRTGRIVQITEFFVHNLMSRSDDGVTAVFRPDKVDLIAELREDFVDMAHKLVKLAEQSPVVSVCDIFEGNGTNYFVVIIDESMAMVEVADAFRGSGHAAWEKVRPIFDILISELEMLHLHGLVHRGIDESTVLIASDGSIRLRGFSVPSARINGKGVQINISDDYAAPEQFTGTPYPDRTADVYSACALMFRCITGIKYTRANRDNFASLFPRDVPACAVSALFKGLSRDPEKRFPTMMELRAALSGEAVPAPELSDSQPQKEGKYAKTRFVIGVFAASLVLLAGIAVAALYFVFDVNVFKANWRPTSSAQSRVYSSIPQTSSELAVMNVPNLLNLKLSDVMDLYGASQKFTFQVQYSAFNDTYPRNIVMKQSPDPNTPSPGLTTVVLTVSRGPEYIVMPSVLGRPLSEVYKELTYLGLDVYLVEVDASYVSTAAVTYDVGIVLDCPTAAKSIVKAESTVILYGTADRTSGPVSTVTNADGTISAWMTPAPVILNGTVSATTDVKGNKVWYLVRAPYELPYTVSYGYDQQGNPTMARVYAPTPGGGTASDVIGPDGTTTRIFTPAPERLYGKVTENLLANGTVQYIFQADPIKINGTVSSLTYPNGTTSQVFIPTPRGGAEIPTASVQAVPGPNGTTSYIVTPLS